MAGHEINLNMTREYCNWWWRIVTAIDWIQSEPMPWVSVVVVHGHTTYSLVIRYRVVPHHNLNALYSGPSTTSSIYPPNDMDWMTWHYNLITTTNWVNMNIVCMMAVVAIGRWKSVMGRMHQLLCTLST